MALPDSAYGGLLTQGTTVVTGRTEAEIAPYFDGLDLVPPGLTHVWAWRPDHHGSGRRRHPDRGTPGDLAAQKPGGARQPGPP